MSLIALYYVCSVGIYYNVYIASKTNKTIRNGQSDITVKYTENSSDNKMVRNTARVKVNMIISL